MPKPNPFAGNKAPPFGKGGAKGKGPLKKGAKPNPFAKEGSPAEEKADAMQGFKKGGRVKK
jgi:hypothetical protein